MFHLNNCTHLISIFIFLGPYLTHICLTVVIVPGVKQEYSLRMSSKVGNDLPIKGKSKANEASRELCSYDSQANIYLLDSATACIHLF